MDWSPFMEKIGYGLIISAVAAVAWIAKSIIKPWSDAALMRANAFNDMVGVLSASVPHIQKKLDDLESASKSSNNALGMNTLATKELTDEIKRKFDSDQVRKERKQLIDELSERFQCKAHEIEMVMRQQEEAKRRRESES